MKAADVKELRKELGCTTRDLAAALGVEQATVLAWERGEQFATKRFVERMDQLREQGPSAVPKTRKQVPKTPYGALADPALWLLVRKLVAYPELRQAAQELSEAYSDPNE